MADDDHLLGMLCHLLGIFTSFVGPLVIWLIKKDDSEHVASNGRSSLNFQFTLLIAYLGLLIVGTVLGIIMPLLFIIFIVVWAAVGIAALVFMIIGTLHSAKGEVYQYPFSIHFLKG